VGRQSFRLQSAGTPFLSIFSEGRRGPPETGGFSGSQIEQIRRTVRQTPEVMVKVTGGGKTVGAVAAHLAYISQRGELEIETDEGQRISKAEQKALVKDWHLELTPGQYRKPQDPDKPGRTIKLVHNIVLSMPAPTPPDKVLAAAKVFAREKFGVKHRYAMALHTHQQHPHVHLVIKAEGLEGRRLHIDKAMLREWREDFARMMRDQGIAANATPRAVRGQGRKGLPAAAYQTQSHGRSHAIRAQVESIARELKSTGAVRDPARNKLAETRKAIVAGWKAVADALDAQGEIVLAGEVRSFATRLPPVLTDRERLAVEFIRHVKAARAARTRGDERARDRADELTR
jgi:Relaxase/Mobilisation nuclease domain